jgi:phytoene dehydrogenase-like protein
MSEDLDVLVLGAGPNGLTAGAYLARAGARVAVVERNVESGGGLTTQELSGFALNSHALYMLLAELMPPYHDLDLAGFGVRFVRPDVQAAFLFEGDTLVLSSDPERSASSVGALSPSDAAVFSELYQDLRRASEEFIIPATYFPPVEPLEQIELLDQAGDVGRWLNDLAEMTPREAIHGYGFSDERVEGALVYLASMFGLDPDGGGMGFLMPVYVYRLMQSALVVGGSHQMASALRRALEAAGGYVVTAADASEILVEGDRAVGVRLADGTTIRSRAIVSTLNPEQNFLGLMDPSLAPPGLVETARSWEWDETSLFVANWGIVGDPPHYEGRPAEVDRALNVVMGIQSVDDAVGHFEAARSGHLPDGSVGHGTCTSLFDPLAAARHLRDYGNCEVLRFECLAPYEGDWDAEKKHLAARAFEAWCHQAPNLAKANVRVSLPWSPKDTEEHLPTMRRGAIKHGAYLSIQMGYNRPSSECSSYRTPVEGLYVAGASTHPGGMVLLGAGYNAARVVAEDLGLPIWWEVPEMVRRAIDHGYLPER